MGFSDFFKNNKNTETTPPTTQTNPPIAPAHYASKDENTDNLSTVASSEVIEIKGTPNAGHGLYVGRMSEKQSPPLTP
jgi:hypothetical protein